MYRFREGGGLREGKETGAHRFLSTLRGVLAPSWVILTQPPTLISYGGRSHVSGLSSACRFGLCEAIWGKIIEVRFC